MKDLLVFVCIYWINVESISTPWEFSNEHCMMISLSVPFPFSSESAPQNANTWRGFVNLQEYGNMLMRCTKIATCRKFGNMNIVISPCWEFYCLPTWLMSFIWSIAWGQASLSMGYFDVLVFSMILVFNSCLLLSHLG